MMSSGITRTPSLMICLGLLLSHPVRAETRVDFDDFNDQNIFNNFSGNTGTLTDHNGYGAISLSFDTVDFHGDDGSALRLDYSFTGNGFCGTWSSLLNHVDHPDYSLDFGDIYGHLTNSAGNGCDVEGVEVLSFDFWAKGNAAGRFDHVIQLEFKDIHGASAVKSIYVPNTGGWEQYSFPAGEMNGVDLSAMKILSLVIPGGQNDERDSHFYIDDLQFTLSEDECDPHSWSADAFLDLVAQRAANYFLVFTDSLGFALDRSTYHDLVSTGATGFQLAALCTGDSRGYISDGEQRVERILDNLAGLPMSGDDSSAGFHGFFYHFLEAGTGMRKDASELSLYDTMLLMYGVLTVKEYFPDNNSIQANAQALFDAVEWDWMVDTLSQEHMNQFHLAWTPENGFLGHVDAYTDEALLVDILALGSVTHPVSMDTYNARQRPLGEYPPDSPDSIAVSWTGSMFTYFFSSCWLDLESAGTDMHSSAPLDIWENNRKAVLANRRFCLDHADDQVGDGDDHYATYGDSCWGLTACGNLVDPATGMLSEYYAFGALPTHQHLNNPATLAPHLGTLAVYGAGCALAYTEHAVSALRRYYDVDGLWNPLFGFGDAFSRDPHTFAVDQSTYQPIFDENSNLIVYPADWLNGGWVNHMNMGIDVGPLILAIDNHRGGMVHDLLNSCVVIQTGCERIFGVHVTDLLIERDSDNTILSWTAKPWSCVYHVYRSGDAYAGDRDWTLVASTSVPTLTIEEPAEIHSAFYRVTWE